MLTAATLFSRACVDRGSMHPVEDGFAQLRPAWELIDNSNWRGAGQIAGRQAKSAPRRARWRCHCATVETRRRAVELLERLTSAYSSAR